MRALLSEGAIAASDAGSSIITPAIVAAIVATIVSISVFLLGQRERRLDRQRQLFAEAFNAPVLYREFVFIIRRRPSNDPSERLHLSHELSNVQVDLAAYVARLKVEAPTVGREYAELVAATKRIAGPPIREAWNRPPVGPDNEMHAPDVDLSGIEPFESAYLAAVQRHLSWWPWHR